MQDFEVMLRNGDKVHIQAINYDAAVNYINSTYGQTGWEYLVPIEESKDTENIDISDMTNIIFENIEQLDNAEGIATIIAKSLYAEGFKRDAESKEQKEIQELKETLCMIDDNYLKVISTCNSCQRKKDCPYERYAQELYKLNYRKIRI